MAVYYVYLGLFVVACLCGFVVDRLVYLSFVVCGCGLLWVDWLVDFVCGLIDCAMLVWPHDCVWLLAMRGEFCVRLGLVGNWLVNAYDLVCAGSVVFDLERRCCVVLVWILCFFVGVICSFVPLWVWVGIMFCIWLLFLGLGFGGLDFCLGLICY